MFCTNCGRDNPDTNKFCLQCGKPLAAARVAAGSSPAAGQLPAPAHPRRSSGRLLLILGGLLLLAILAAAAYFLLPGLLSGRGGNEMLLVIPDRDFEEIDLTVLRLGDEIEEAVVIAERVSFDHHVVIGTMDAGYRFDDNFWGIEFERFLGSVWGSFLPNTDRLIIPYHDDGETKIVEYVAGAEAPTEILSGDNEFFGYYGYFIPDTRDLFFAIRTDNDAWQCYLTSPGEEADRVSRSNFCFSTLDGRHVVSINQNRVGGLTVTATDMESGDETTLLDDVEGVVDLLVSADARHIAYQTGDTGEQRLVVLNAAGEEIFDSDEFERTNDWGFVGLSGTLWFIVPNGDVWELYTSAGGRPLAEAPALSVLPTPDGTTLAVLTEDEDGAGEVSVINLASGESVEVAAGDHLQMVAIADPARLLVKEASDGDLTLTAAELSGANPVTLFDESNYSLLDIYHIPGDERLLLEVGDDNGRYNLYVAPLDGSPGFFVIEDWYRTKLLNLAGDTLLLAGREDERDDEILYALKLASGAEPVELDDSALYYHFAVIAPDGRSALYNANAFEGSDEVATVRQISLDGEEPPEVLYEDALIAAVRWSEINPFSLSPNHGFSLNWMGAGDLIQPASALSLPDDVVAGKAFFDTTCIACHGPGGVGVEGLGKPFTTSEFLLRVNDRQLLEFIEIGRPISHPDNTTGVDMPPKGGNPALTDEQLMDIIAYIRTLHW